MDKELRTIMMGGFNYFLQNENIARMIVKPSFQLSSFSNEKHSSCTVLTKFPVCFSLITRKKLRLGRKI